MGSVDWSLTEFSLGLDGDDVGEWRQTVDAIEETTLANVEETAGRMDPGSPND